MNDKIGPRGAAYVVQRAQQRLVKLVELSAIDPLGRLLTISLPVTALETILDDGFAITGEALGFTRDHELVLVPEPETFTVDDERGVARLIAELQLPSGAPSPLCSRSTLKRQLARAGSGGATFYIGASVECHWLAGAAEARRAPAGVGERLARQATLALDAAGVAVRASYPGRAADGSHWVFDLDWVDPLTLADSIAVFRGVVRHSARSAGYDVTFMPHPWSGAPRARLDLFVSLLDGGASVYHDPLDPGGLSRSARAFGAHLAAEVKALELVFKSTVNSYSVGEWPRVVMTASGRGEGGTAMHVRGSDALANPYLVIALIIGVALAAQGGSGEPPRQKSASAATLREAARAAEGSEIMRVVLGGDLLEHLVSAAHNESRAWRAEVTPWEITRYLTR